MVKRIKQLLKRILFPNTYSSEAYISYLKKKGVMIGEHCYVWSPNHTLIDLQRPETLIIGDYCKITQGVTILSHDYSMSVARRKYHEHVGDVGRTIIGDNVFIGINAIILMGAKIGNNCIVGAGSVVSGCFPDNSVIAGNPARVVCTLQQYFQKHKEKEYDKAKEFFCIFKEYHKRIPTVIEMGNAFAWLYLPRTEETIMKYPSFFKLSGDNEKEVIQDFMASSPMFENYESFCNQIESGEVIK